MKPVHLLVHQEDGVDLTLVGRVELIPREVEGVAGHEHIRSVVIFSTKPLLSNRQKLFHVPVFPVIVFPALFDLCYVAVLNGLAIGLLCRLDLAVTINLGALLLIRFRSILRKHLHLVHFMKHAEDSVFCLFGQLRRLQGIFHTLVGSIRKNKNAAEDRDRLAVAFNAPPGGVLTLLLEQDRLVSVGSVGADVLLGLCRSFCLGGRDAQDVLGAVQSTQKRLPASGLLFLRPDLFPHLFDLVFLLFLQKGLFPGVVDDGVRVQF